MTRPFARYIPPDDDLSSKVAKLEKENERLRDRIELLEHDLLGEEIIFPAAWALTFSEQRVVALLLSRPFARKGQLMTALYRERAGEEPDIKVLDVWMCRIRKKLAIRDIEIRTVWGVGWAIDNPRRDEVASTLGLPLARGGFVGSVRGAA